ncbi:hypothetical protein CRG98_005370 [Punica granatum]|uniref:Uncharacterized protein n=1 Tax=Punica granatum TaxID=22663 RepID=A0A2I0L0M1_PUNGR|nr:hypothetical protein CRG98_005370 [Punica granatum]
MHSEVESFEPFALANLRDKRIKPARSKTPFGVTLAKARVKERHNRKPFGVVVAKGELFFFRLRGAAPRVSHLWFHTHTTAVRVSHPLRCIQGFTPTPPQSGFHTRSAALGFHTHTTAVRDSHPFRCNRVSHPHHCSEGFTSAPLHLGFTPTLLQSGFHTRSTAFGFHTHFSLISTYNAGISHYARTFY